jgi:serine/threonine-protein kinase
MPVEQAVEFVLQACVAVADAHALGIVHRDLKPANLFCIRRSDGQLSIKVLDFGISKLTDLSGTGPGMAMTKTSALMGSPLYMSPEQMRSSKDVDAQTDIWALGIILFELMTGRSAFLAESVTELAIKVASEPTPMIRTFRPDVPPALEAIISKCLEKDKRQRFRNVGELALALLPFAPKRAKASVQRISGIIQSAGLSESALAVPPSPPADATQVSPGTLPPVGRTTVGASKAKQPIFAIGLVTLLVVGGAVSALAVSRRLASVRNDTPVPSQAAAPAATQPPQPVVAADPPRPSEARAADPPRAAAPSATPDAGRRLTAAVAQPKKTGASVAAPGLAPPPAPSPVASAPAVVPASPDPPAAAQAAPSETAAKPNCDPPYYYNASHVRVFKQECL